MNWRVEVAQNAARRRAVAVRQDLSRGLVGLATVAATAPFVGLFGNLLGIYGAFHGITGDKTSIMADIAGHMAESIEPTAFGVAVAVVAMFGYQYLRARVGEMDSEMQAVILELPRWLAAIRE